jgi:hypothetical protein
VGPVGGSRLKAELHAVQRALNGFESFARFSCFRVYVTSVSAGCLLDRAKQELGDPGGGLPG